MVMLNVNSLRNRAKSTVQTFTPKAQAVKTTFQQKVNVPGLPITMPAKPAVVDTKPNEFLKPKEELQKSVAPSPPIMKTLPAKRPPVSILPAKPPMSVLPAKPPMSVLPAKPPVAIRPPVSKIPDMQPINVVPIRPVTPITPTPKTSIRKPSAVKRATPRVYSKSKSKRRVFRAARLQPTMRPLQPRRKPAWTPAPPASRHFMKPVRPGQYSFQPKTDYAAKYRQSQKEVARLKNQVNTINADALKTKQDYEADRQRLQNELNEYEASPLFTTTKVVGKNARGMVSVLDTGAKLMTPSVNGMSGFPQVSEGMSKVAALGLGLFAVTFLIGRVE
jgi:hypothetical protein